MAYLSDSLSKIRLSDQIACHGRCPFALAFILLTLIYIPNVPCLEGKPDYLRPTTIQLSVDATDAATKIIHSCEIIPVGSGPITLYYPKWIPGEHGPTGPIGDIAGLVIRANGHEVDWHRDPHNMFCFHVDHPEGVDKLEIKLDYLATSPPGAFISGASIGRTFAVLNWNDLLLYSGDDASNINISLKVSLPSGWHFATALKAESQDGNKAVFAPVTLVNLIDSPLIAGATFREIELGNRSGKNHFLDIVSDNEQALEVAREELGGLENVIGEAGKLFGARHYDSYHFLVSLSDMLGSTGLEHHQSSDDRLPERSFLDKDRSLLIAWLLPHEYTHSWNGKFRRPDGLTGSDFQKPADTGLLWVYEGLTTYYGEVLATRSGLWTQDQFREELALKLASMDYRPGRTWRTVQDTATSSQILAGVGNPYDSWTRGLDYYAEGELIWLEADVLIRRLSNGRRSLDDFCRAFYGSGGDSGPKMVPYTFEDVVDTLNDVSPNDWRSFLLTRLNAKSPQAPLAGLRGAGYELTFVAEATQMEAIRERIDDILDARFSLGAIIKPTGEVINVIYKSPFFLAGIVPGSKIISIDGKMFAFDRLRHALSSSQGTSTRLEFLIGYADNIGPVTVDYHDGEKYRLFRFLSGSPREGVEQARG